MERHDLRNRTSDRPRVPDSAGAGSTVTQLVMRWQETGCHAAFERLVQEVLPEVRRAVERALRRRGVHDPAAADDAVALVLDHLRRLAGSDVREREVTKFVPAAGRQPQDQGRRYIGRLAQDRTIDVLRSRRRQKGLPFSQIAADGGRSLEANLEGDAARAAAPLIDRLRNGLTKLEPRQRMLVELLLAGKSQTAIAHVLGLSEGTVSRLRARAIDTLRRLLADE